MLANALGFTHQPLPSASHQGSQAAGPPQPGPMVSAGRLMICGCPHLAADAGASVGYGRLAKAFRIELIRPLPPEAIQRTLTP
jgi:hypothetical protein